MPKTATRNTTTPKTETRAKAGARTYGGVAANMRQPALQGSAIAKGVEGTDMLVTQPVSPAHPNFTYHGGPVIACSTVYSSFWGDQWLTDPASTQRAGRLAQYMKDLLASKYQNILSQYGAGNGAGGAGIFVRSGFISNVPSNLDETSIHSTIQACINAGAVPEPGSPSHMAFMIFLADNIAVNSANLGAVMCEPNGDTAFGYHYFFTTAGGHKFYYSVIPGLTNTCLQKSCGNDATCSLHLNQTQEQRQTQVASHEYAEMVTDPELTAWYEPGAENGDICNGEAATIVVGPNTWTVQRMYSKFDDINSNGAVQCVVEPANPIPKLAGGPASALELADQLKLSAPDSFARLLPLPTFHFNAKTRSYHVDKKEMHSYQQRLSHPLDLAHIVGEVSNLLTAAGKSK
jgi:hypothetical protein